MPTGYAYRPLYRTGDPLPGGGEPATHLPGAVKINNRSEVIFRTVHDSQGAPNHPSVGVYGLDLEWTTDGPVVAASRRIVAEGDQATFPDLGLRGAPAKAPVADFGLADLNHDGTVAIKMRPEGGGTETLFVNRQRQGFESVLGFQDKTPDGESHFGAALFEHEIGNNDDLAVTAAYIDQKSKRPLEGLFHLPGGKVDENGKVLLRSGDMLPETNDTIGGFGLFQFDGSKDDFVCQVHTTPVKKDSNSQDTGGTALLTGRTAERYAQSLRVRAGSNLSLAAGLAESHSVLVGDVLYGPRIGDGKTASVVHLNDDFLVLTFKNRVVAATNGYTPTGHKITGLGGPVVSSAGLVYFVAYTEGDDVTEQLIVSDGTESSVMLSAPSPLFGDQWPELITIAFGLTKKQINDRDHLVFIGEFDDKSKAVIIGWPV
jgi:hypothetical protein